MVRNGSASCAVTGGAEASITFGAMKGWEAMRIMSTDTCRPFSKDRKGMLIGEDDLAKACGDLVSKDLTLAFSDEKPTERTCPRCDRALVSCQVSFAPVKAKAPAKKPVKK